MQTDLVTIDTDSTVYVWFPCMPAKLYVHCTGGWVNISEFEITVCDRRKMSKKTKLAIFNFFKILLFCKNP